MKHETERLLVREFSPSDSPFILTLLNEPGFISNIRDTQVRTTEQALAYIEKLTLGCVTLKDGTPVGMCGLLQRDSLPEMEIGFAFLEKYSGKGFATESAKATLKHAHTTLGKETILAIVRPENLASRKVLEKIGMKSQGMVKLPHDPKELCLYESKSTDIFRHTHK